MAGPGRGTGRLLLVNGAFNVLGAAVLAAGAYRLSAWLALTPRAAFLWYLLGGASLSLAALSFGASRLADKTAVRLICGVFVVFHGTAAIVSAWVAITGLTPVVWLNSAVHLAFCLAFWRTAWTESARAPMEI